MTVQIAGPIGPFLDTVQQRQVACEVVATCDYTLAPGAPPADRAALDQRVQAQLLRAIREVTAAGMASGALQFKNLSEGADLILPQVVAASGLAQEGVLVGGLVMTFGVDGRPPKRWNLSAQPAPAAAPAVPNVGVRLHVGGINISASTRGGVDAAGVARQVGDRVKSAVIWYAVAGVLVLAILGGVGLYGRHVVSQSLHGASGAPGAAARWDGKTPFSCAGNESVTLTGVTANLPGTAITALGNCSLTLVNVEVTAPTAIEAAGNATVVVRGGKITGTTHAASALGNARVTFSGTKVTGKTQSLGNGKVTGG